MCFFSRLLELWVISASDGKSSFSLSSAHGSHTEATPKSQRVSEMFAKEVNETFRGKLDALKSARAGASDILARVKQSDQSPTGIHAGGAQQNRHVWTGAG